MRARLGTTAHCCKVVVLKLRAVESCLDLVQLSIGTALTVITPELCGAGNVQAPGVSEAARALGSSKLVCYSLSRHR